MIEELKAGLSLFGEAVAILKALLPLLPAKQRKEVEEKLADAETKFLEARAKTAKELGYRLCRCTYPPQIMLFVADEKADVCPRCQHKFQAADVTLIRY